MNPSDNDLPAESSSSKTKATDTASVDNTSATEPASEEASTGDLSGNASQENVVEVDEKIGKSEAKPDDLSESTAQTSQPESNLIEGNQSASDDDVSNTPDQAQNNSDLTSSTPELGNVDNDVSSEGQGPQLEEESPKLLESNDIQAVRTYSLIYVLHA
jgi:hypothetical protein